MSCGDLAVCVCGGVDVRDYLVDEGEGKGREEETRLGLQEIRQHC